MNSFGPLRFLRRSRVVGLDTLVAAIFLAAGFSLVVLYFDVVDLRQLKFFAHGNDVIIYNFVRVAFSFFLIWIIFATGIAIVAAFPVRTRSQMSPAETLVVGFGAGVGVWHVLMLGLGVLGLTTSL